MINRRQFVSALVAFCAIPRAKKIEYLRLREGALHATRYDPIDRCYQDAKFMPPERRARSVQNTPEMYVRGCRKDGVEFRLASGVSKKWHADHIKFLAANPVYRDSV